jgi:primosomal protein N' (replication factor Y)
MLIARVALDVPIARLFDYLCLPEQEPQPGLRVIVPFGRMAQGTQRSGNAVGVIVELTDHSEVPESKLKPVVEVLHDLAPLSAEWLKLTDFCSRYYQKPIGEVMLPALPPRLRTGKPWPKPETPYRLAMPIEDVLRQIGPRAKRKRALVERIGADSVLRSALETEDRSALKDLLQLHLVEEALPNAAAEPQGGTGFIRKHPLTEVQSAVISSITEGLGQYKVHLIHGITGSGKTEIYFHLIAEVIAAGKQALVLVPEIALTPALRAAFAERFPEAVISIQHSAMPEQVRVAGWIDAQTGKAQIVVGTRLAALAPMANLGLIVVDEEQDASFKQQEGLRYSARDVAIYRASQCAVPVVLCSATPSLESYQHALTGRYQLHTLEARANVRAKLPVVRLVDTRNTKLTNGLSVPLVTAMEQTLARGEQVLVFLNRRGYAPVLSCTSCGWVSGCRNCAANLVVHLSERSLRCHHCGHAEGMPKSCPDCGNLDLQPLGRGTQRLEGILAERFPAARVLRIDGDSTRNRGSLESLLNDVHEGRADIILGTQILAKGHHFSKLTLVAVLNADAGLFASDYRASEKLFAQLEQVAGRAGRDDLPGTVWIQTRFPGHPLYQALMRHDYRGFAQSLLAEREQAGFPPFAFEAALRAESEVEADATAFLTAAMESAPERPQGLTVYHPVPLAIPRMARMHRAHVLVQSASRASLQKFLRDWTATLQSLRLRGVRWHVDVDPTEF